MIHHVWRLSEPGEHNLGLACTEEGLVLGRTPLIERRGGCFITRERHEIARLLGKAYAAEELSLDRLMRGLFNVAAALNANDQCLARLAAVHLEVPDLSDRAARDAMEAEDVLIKYARDEGSSSNWNPALHPRTGTPPNPGWFAPTGAAESSSIRTAQNENPNQGPDASTGSVDGWVTLRGSAKRIDELADFAEWLANAKPQDEQAIRAEIKRYYEDVGWDSAARDLNNKLSVILRPGVTPEIRQRILGSIDLYTRVDPAEYVGVRDFLNAAILAAAGPLTAAQAPSPVWKLGWGKRGQIIDAKFRDPTFPVNFPIIDKIPNGIATSVKSIDLNAATYQNEAILIKRVEKYVADVREFEPTTWGGKIIDDVDVTGRAVQLVVPKGSMTDARRIIIETIRARAKRGKTPVDIIITEL